MILTQTSRNVECKGKTDVDAETPKRCVFEAAISPKRVTKYGLKIFAEEFDPKPCLRFCSRGPAHINRERGLGLEDRLVPTPHFHKVTEQGIMVAYQPLPLFDPEECARIVDDPQLGTNLFCQETNLVSPSGGPVVLKIIAAELALSTVDPLSGATFPPS